MKNNTTLRLNKEKIIAQLYKYELTKEFTTQEELEEWLLNLNNLEIHNILNLNANPKSIKFPKKLLINKNLLNTLDYNKRIEALISIKNAEGWYHLFENLLKKEFLISGRFYKDIEILKKAPCAQTPLWIVGETTFINSPYHEEDLKLLVTAKDSSEKKFDYVIWDAIATMARNHDSIYSGYHQKDLQTVLKYGSDALQLSHSYPEMGINSLATNKVSLQDEYHLENMELLAQNQDIGNFLFAIMTNKEAIEKKNYRAIIREMIENKKNKYYVFLLCYYAVGEKVARRAQNIIIKDYFFEVSLNYNIKDLLEKVEDKINTIDGEFKEITTLKIETNIANQRKLKFPNNKN